MVRPTPLLILHSLGIQGEWVGLLVDVEGDSDFPRGQRQEGLRECTVLQLAKVREVWWVGPGSSSSGCGAGWANP